MFKIKPMVGLAVLVTTLFALAAPAMAEFQSNNGQSQGPIGTYPETTTFESVEGGPAITCKAKNAAEEVVAKGEWVIQVKGFTQQGKFFFQAPSLKGPHEQLKFTKWGVCTGPTGIVASVQCTLQVEIGSQNGNPASAGNATGGPYGEGCKVVLGTGENTCTVLVQAEGNKELAGVTLKNGGTGVEISSSVPGISSVTQETKTLCKTLGVKGGQKSGKFFTKNPLITSEQKLV